MIKVDRDSLRVLDQTGSVRVMLPSNISNKLERRKNAVATDREGAEIRIDDTIKEYGGEGKTGRVLHLKGNYVFAHNREAVENAGVFVARTNGVTTVVAKGGRAVQSDLTRMNPAMQRNGGKPMPQAMPPPRSMGKDRLIGKTVAPRTGPYKGYLGIVKDTTDTHARIEMYTKKNIVTVPKANLSIRDPNTGEVIQSDALRPGRPGGAPGAGGRTQYGGATPGGRAGATPRGADGGRTPAWKQAGGRTPAWQQGGKTPYGSGAAAGGKTPAWAAGGAGSGTAYGGTTYGGATAYGGSTAYGGVSHATSFSE